MELWSNAYLDGGHGWATAALEVGPWRRITCDYGESGRLFVELKLDGAAAPFYMALGTPVQPPAGGARGLFEEGMTQGVADRLYLPPWALQMLGLIGCGEFVSVDWFSQDVFPSATRIVLRPHDSAFYHADAKEELEVALTRLGVVQQGTTVAIPLDCLGGFEVMFDVMATEPANIVLAEGDEVVIEFEEALDAAAPVAATAAPAAAPATLDEDDAMLPMATSPPPAPAATGHTLGGPASERRMPDGSRWNPWKHGPWTGP